MTADNAPGWESKPVLVTGGSGFLGAFVVRDLIARGLSVRVFDLRPDVVRLDQVAMGLSSQVSLIAGDVADASAVTEAMRGCGAVVHLAGLMTVDCRDNPALAARVNLNGAQVVTTAAIEAGARRFAYASSASVYGAGEGRLARPETLYGVHKLALEGMARCAWLDHGMPSFGVRPYIVYGFGESRGIAAGPSIAIRAAAIGQSARIGFSGRVGFVHVEDVSGALVEGLYRTDQGAHVHDMNGETAGMERFVAALREQVPDAQVEIAGDPLKTPEILRGGDPCDWLSDRPVTGIPAGISRSLKAWGRAPGGVDDTSSALAAKAIELSNE